MCYCNGFIDLSTLQVQWAKHHCPDSVYAPFQRGPCNSRCLAATSLNCTKSQHRRRPFSQLSHVSLSEYMKRERECKFPLNVLLTHPSHRQIHGLFTTSRLHVLRNLSFVGVSTLASLVSWAYASQKIAYCQIWLLRAFMCLQAILYFFLMFLIMVHTWSHEVQRCKVHQKWWTLLILDFPNY